LAAFLAEGSLARQWDIGAIERRQKELRDSLAGASPVDESFAAGEPYQAYAYLVDHRLLAEAEQAARALLDAVHPTDREMLEIYRGAATHGLVPLAFHVLNRLPSSGRTIAMPWELWYPVSCSDLVREHAAANGLPADLLLAVIREESKFDTAAVSVDGARGLMQLLPSTTAWLASRSGSVGPSSEDLFAPSVNIAWGARFLSYLIGRYDGSVVGALAAYNAGEGRMRQWRESFDPAGDPLVAVEMIGPRETRRYVRQVLDALSAYRTIADGGRPQP
jgi:soluble lytic murein transglycosylase